MPTITDLPCELVATILRNLDDLRSLLASLLSCRRFYVAFRESPGIETDVITQQITPALLPLAVAVSEASRIVRSPNGSAVHDLLNTLYDDGARLGDRTASLTRDQMIQMARLHDIIHKFATTFAAEAWSCLIQEDIDEPSVHPGLSDSEYFRFCRAFYRVDLYYKVCRVEPFNMAQNRYKWFFSRHAPWETEQLACVVDFLDAKFAAASHDVVAHDIDFGELDMDYLSKVENNIWRQTWLAEGMEYIYRVMNETSFDVKKEILFFTSGNGHAVDICREIQHTLNNNLGADPTVDLSAYADEELQSLLPTNYDNPDTDKGPYEAWRAGHSELPYPEWVMVEDTARFRRQAYVLWDFERIQKQEWLEIFTNESGTLPDPDDKDLEEMRISFHERSKIWLKGGEGYWSKGDLSRIKWQQGCPLVE